MKNGLAYYSMQLDYSGFQGGLFFSTKRSSLLLRNVNYKKLNLSMKNGLAYNSM